ncbi:MAG TPA: hypothetical protein VGB75_16455 [Jatrophihabitans sp.]|jgi:hypothetical protein|uniref:hypothetical protein n=1 Tax=Jatrophihabitans sp. TaxID=1932789 RepID=UPI002F226FA3
MKNALKRSPLATVVKGAAVVAASAVLAFSNTTPALGETGWIYVHGGKARWDSLNRLQYCDTLVDGNRVRVQLAAYVGATVYYSGWAPSGGCYTEGHPTSIQVFRVCAENNGCSAWYHR